MRSGIDLSHVDQQVRPQDDLYRHVNGSWLATAHIPADRPVDGAFHHLRDLSESRLRAIIEKAAGADAPEGSIERKIGDLYACFMDEAAIEARGMTPIADDLERIKAIASREDLVALVAHFQRSAAAGFFGMWVDTDDRQSDRYVINMTQGGIGMPDESYYREDTHAGTRDAYVAHVTRMFELIGWSSPASAAAAVLALETELASHHWDRVRCRDAHATYNLMSADDFAGHVGEFPWQSWLSAFAAPDGAFADVVVRQPSYFAALAAVMSNHDLEAWRAWLAWQVTRSSASLLSSDFVQENFAFYGTTLTGTPSIKDRWKRGVGLVEGALGEAVGQLYVAEHFPPAAKARMMELVDNLVEAYRRSISTLPWMGEETRARALEKLAAFTPKIGYPDTWRDYSALHIDRHDLVGNARRSAQFERARDLAKIGGPVDRGEWFMYPQTVNAYYNPGMNEIVFPAAILQPPFFDLEADDAVNYGGIGAVIGHEIGHGFDDQGSKYDGAGNLVDWWTDADRAEFDTRTQALIAQYDALEPEENPGHRVNGSLTVGENIGDLGGLGIAYQAYLLALDGQEPPVIDGMTGAQRFFFAWAQVWRTKIRAEESLRRLTIDPHSPAEFRCNAVVRNLDEFHEAFALTPADALWMEPEQRVRIW